MVNLLANILQFDPEKRLTCEQALGDPFFSEPLPFGFLGDYPAHDPEDEPSGEELDDTFEHQKYTLEELKSKLLISQWFLLVIENFYFILRKHLWWN